MSYHRLNMPFFPCFVVMLFWCVSFNSSAQSASLHDLNTGTVAYFGGNGSDEDTILIEDSMKFTLSYSRALQAFCKHILNIDVDSAFSLGENKRSAVIRKLDDISERTYYRLQLNQNEVTLKFTLNL